MQAPVLIQGLSSCPPWLCVHQVLCSSPGRAFWGGAGLQVVPLQGNVALLRMASSIRWHCHRAGGQGGGFHLFLLFCDQSAVQGTSCCPCGATSRWHQRACQQHRHLMEVLERLRGDTGTDPNLWPCFPTAHVGQELPQLPAALVFVKPSVWVNILQLYHTRRFEVQGD